MRVVAIALLVLAQQAAPPSVEEIQTWYQAGQYQQVVDEAAQIANPKGQYFLASSYQKLHRVEEARGVYERLVGRGESDAWALIARSASALLTDGAPPLPENVERAFLAAQQAIGAVTSAPSEAAATTGPGSAVAHYQMGLVQSFQNDYANAAASFEQTTSIDPAFAYGYYYGGLANSRIDRPDATLINLERFLQLAPNAPEAPRVQSLMRSVRGR